LWAGWGLKPLPVFPADHRKYSRQPGPGSSENNYFNNPSIPDRTAAILYQGESPLPALRESLKFLEKAGAELAAIPCLTAHYYLDELKGTTRLQLINLVEETGSYLKKLKPPVKKAGLLATEGTIATGLFRQPFQKKI